MVETKSDTRPQRILTYLSRVKIASAKEVSVGLHEKYGPISTTLLRLEKKHKVRKLSRGVYEAIVGAQSTENHPSSSATNIDLENVDVVLQLKDRYGKRRLLSILEKIKRIIE